MKERFSIPVIKHLEDHDDLTQGRDADLEPGQEQESLKIIESLEGALERDNYDVSVFFVSPKKRAQQTSNIIATGLKERHPNLRILIRTEGNLREIDQGVFVLPKDYIPGDVFEGLKLAGEIFNKETFSPNGPKYDNLLYRYGDPLIQEDGTYKYPELKVFFEEAGESYRDVLIRFYTAVLNLSEDMHRIKGRALPAVFTHGQPHQIFNDLSEVADLLSSHKLVIRPGELPRICWKLYQQRRTSTVPFGKVDFVVADRITDPAMISLLESEIEQLISIDGASGHREDPVA